MRRLGLITLISAVVVLGAAAAFFVTQADADLVGQLRGNQPAAKPAAMASEEAQHAEGKDVQTATYKSWTVRCSADAAAAGNRKCSATNRIVDQKTGKALLVWVIGKDAKNNVVSYFQTPTGVLIGEGLTLILSDSDNYKIAFRSCDNRRCDATVQMNEQMIQRIAQIEKLSVKVVSTTGYNLVFNIENAGISDVLKAI